MIPKPDNLTLSGTFFRSANLELGNGSLARFRLPEHLTQDKTGRTDPTLAISGGKTRYLPLNQP